MSNIFEFTKNTEAKKLNVIREFDAPVEKVWKAWTDPDLLEKWWGPKPWIAKTKTMDFTVGGAWLYAMVGPDGQKHWSYVTFTAITDGSTFSATAQFCDEDGNIIASAPKGYWLNKFLPAGENKTRVEVELSFDEEASFKRLVEMGFEGGFTIGLNQLEELLAAEA